MFTALKWYYIQAKRYYIAKKQEAVSMDGERLARKVLTALINNVNTKRKEAYIRERHCKVMCKSAFKEWRSLTVQILGERALEQALADQEAEEAANIARQQHQRKEFEIAFHIVRNELVEE